MTVVTISSEVDPVQELTKKMNSCADASGDKATQKENFDEKPPCQNARPQNYPSTQTHHAGNAAHAV